MRVQEKLRLPRASSVQRTSLREHIAWLDERIDRLDVELTHVLRSSAASPPRWRSQLPCAS